MSVMPNVNKYLGEQGVRYENHYCTVGKYGTILTVILVIVCSSREC